MKSPATTAGWFWLAMAPCLAGQDQSSLSDPEIEIAESRAALQGLAGENASLGRQLEDARATVRALAESLALANGEAEVFRRQAADLKLQMEALGVDAVGTDKSRLEQRLLKAVRDLAIVHEEREKLADLVARISEALVRLLKTAESVDPEARMDLEAELRAAQDLLGVVPLDVPVAGALPASLTDAMVISVKEEYSLVVANVGARAGVRLGMPFAVFRGERAVGSIRVVEVRDAISGSVIQDLVSDKERIKVGDRLRVEAR